MIKPKPSLQSRSSNKKLRCGFYQHLHTLCIQTSTHFVSAKAEESLEEPPQARASMRTAFILISGTEGLVRISVGFFCTD